MLPFPLPLLSPFRLAAMQLWKRKSMPWGEDHMENCLSLWSVTTQGPSNGPLSVHWKREGEWVWMWTLLVPLLLSQSHAPGPGFCFPFLSNKPFDMASPNKRKGHMCMKHLSVAIKTSGKGLERGLELLNPAPAVFCMAFQIWSGGLWSCHGTVCIWGSQKSWGYPG
jgi:hypothetical protein